ncbi:hypothetical protein F4819DRAFT_451158, partial [Hypoxylon fuscum]
MQLTNFLSSVLALGALTPLASASCYSGGDKWGDAKDQVLKVIENVCQADLNSNDIRRPYTWGNHPEAKTGKAKFSVGNRCVTLQVDYIWDPHTDDISKIIFMDTGLESGTIPRAECKDGLKKEVNGCEHGGESSYTHWKYKADIQANC